MSLILWCVASLRIASCSLTSINQQISEGCGLSLPSLKRWVYQPSLDDDTSRITLAFHVLQRINSMPGLQLSQLVSELREAPLPSTASAHAEPSKAKLSISTTKLNQVTPSLSSPIGLLRSTERNFDHLSDFTSIKVPVSSLLSPAADLIPTAVAKPGWRSPPSPPSPRGLGGDLALPPWSRGFPLTQPVHAAPVEMAIVDLTSDTDVPVPSGHPSSRQHSSYTSRDPQSPPAPYDSPRSQAPSPCGTPRTSLLSTPQQPTHTAESLTISALCSPEDPHPKPPSYTLLSTPSDHPARTLEPLFLLSPIPTHVIEPPFATCPIDPSHILTPAEARLDGPHKVNTLSITPSPVKVSTDPGDASPALAYNTPRLFLGPSRLGNTLIPSDSAIFEHHEAVQAADLDSGMLSTACSLPHAISAHAIVASAPPVAVVETSYLSSPHTSTSSVEIPLVDTLKGRLRAAGTQRVRDGPSPMSLDRIINKQPIVNGTLPVTPTSPAAIKRVVKTEPKRLCARKKRVVVLSTSPSSSSSDSASDVAATGVESVLSGRRRRPVSFSYSSDFVAGVLTSDNSPL
ncbi:hypothetical protein FA95DRAFT_646952 [Auriscalpium vulgare]|uniref:Uncharacterized protein n=1 Tax=Auriscalpium vulgare TaxID=40419 RepID=A0ACB8S389_9AGAM|nr:hypothetical protein FA95DRAFT_646952 [Auriscalpium vulgare]